MKGAFVFSAGNLILRKKGGQGSRRHVCGALLIQRELFSGQFALSPHSMDCCRGLGWAGALRSQVERRVCGVWCAGAEPRWWCGGNSTS